MTDATVPEVVDDAAPLGHDITPDAIHAFIQTERMNIIPSVGSDTKLKMELLRDLGRTATDQKKIKVDDAANKNQAEMIAVMAKSIKKFNVHDGGLDEGSAGVTPPTAGAPIVEDVINKDEIDTNLNNVDYDELFGKKK